MVPFIPGGYMNNILIVPAKAVPDDVNEYIRIAHLVQSRFNHVATTVNEVLREIEGSNVYMICRDEQTVGYISYQVLAPAQVYISEIQIEPEFQGRGIGGFALDTILKKLKKFELIELLTHPESSAQKLYERHGFRATGDVMQNYNCTGTPRMRMVLHRRLA